MLIERDERFFAAEFQRRVAKERLGLDAHEIPGGQLVALSNPSGLADMLVAYAAPLRLESSSHEVSRRPARGAGLVLNLSTG